MTLNDAWVHFDHSCPGEFTGIEVRLENGLAAFIHKNFLSDSRYETQESYLKKFCIGQVVNCRITKIDFETVSIKCSLKPSDVMDTNGKWHLEKDEFYDTLSEHRARTGQEEKKHKVEASVVPTMRHTSDKCFKNIGYEEAENLMAAKTQGEVLFRASTKRVNELRAMWKVTDHICQVVEIREEHKEHAYSIGKSLWIGSQQFEDLNDIHHNYVDPMASYARDVIGCSQYRELRTVDESAARQMIDQHCKKQKVFFLVSAFYDRPGYFLFYYLSQTGRVGFEYFKVTPHGYVLQRYPGKPLHNFNKLINWFVHSRTSQSPVVKTPRYTLPRVTEAATESQSWFSSQWVAS